MLQAINDRGNTIRSEAQFSFQDNAALADLERETRTILEAHEVRFYEERFGSVGPLGRLGPTRCYPVANSPSENTGRYPLGDASSKQSFPLENPVDRLRQQ